MPKEIPTIKPRPPIETPDKVVPTPIDPPITIPVDPREEEM